jgi:hypothetical protein
MMELYLHSPRVLIAQGLINEAQGQFYHFTFVIG